MDAFDVIIKLGIALVVLLGIWWMLQPKWTIRVVVDQHGVRSHRGIASRRVGVVKEFFDNDIRVDGKLTVFAQRDPRGYLRVWVRGVNDAGVQQRIRNFFVSTL